VEVGGGAPAGFRTCDTALGGLPTSLTCLSLGHSDRASDLLGLLDSSVRHRFVPTVVPTPSWLTTALQERSSCVLSAGARFLVLQS
jgi:hypothetical protein